LQFVAYNFQQQTVNAFHRIVNGRAPLKESLKLALERYISPITGPRCPEGSRKLRFPDHLKIAQDGGKVVSLTHRPPLPPGNTPGTHFY